MIGIRDKTLSAIRTLIYRWFGKAATKWNEQSFQFCEKQTMIHHTEKFKKAMSTPCLLSSRTNTSCWARSRLAIKSFLKPVLRIVELKVPIQVQRNRIPQKNVARFPDLWVETSFSSHFNWLELQSLGSYDSKWLLIPETNLKKVQADGGYGAGKLI